jgi:hypothetical protein
MDKLPHEILIEKAKIDVSTLPKEIQDSIALLKSALIGAKARRDNTRIEQIKANSEIISRHIYDYYVDEEDQNVDDAGVSPVSAAADIIEAAEENKSSGTQVPVAGSKDATVKPVANVIATVKPVENPPAELKVDEPRNQNERALANLVAKGIVTNVSKTILRQHGFDTGFTGPLSFSGCRCGKYSLVPSGKNDQGDKIYNVVSH